MKEYIEREAAVSMAHGYCHTTGGRCCGPDDVVELYEELKAIPVADVVEVVRCGECIFWAAPPSCEGLARCATGESGVRYRKAYDFCSRGRKKMDGGVNNAAD